MTKEPVLSHSFAVLSNAKSAKVRREKYMNLLEFQLRPLKDIVPWGEKPEQFLSWFGLTDGFYHINVGNKQLYRYSNEILIHWSEEFSDEEYPNQPFMDYQITRLYDDLLYDLPDMVQPIPKMIYNNISSIQKQKDWEESIEAIDWPEEDAAEYDDFYDTYITATEWMFFRRLQGLGGNPGIIIFCVEDSVHIRWENTDIKQDGIQTWASTSGEYILPIKKFMAEVTSFHNRFMKEMAERVHLITTINPLPHIKIDLDKLNAEQIEREQSLNEALKIEPRVKDLDKVNSSIDQLLITKI